MSITTGDSRRDGLLLLLQMLKRVAIDNTVDDSELLPNHRPERLLLSNGRIDHLRAFLHCYTVRINGKSST